MLVIRLTVQTFGDEEELHKWEVLHQYPCTVVSNYWLCKCVNNECVRVLRIIKSYATGTHYTSIREVWFHPTDYVNIHVNRQCVSRQTVTGHVYMVNGMKLHGKVVKD